MNPQPPKQIIYGNVQLAVNTMPDGNVALIINAPTEQIVIPMPPNIAQDLGKKLSAPSLEVVQADAKIVGL